MKMYLMDTVDVIDMFPNLNVFVLNHFTCWILDILYMYTAYSICISSAFYIRSGLGCLFQFKSLVFMYDE